MKKIFMTCYGGGHAEIIKEVYKNLINISGIEITIFSKKQFYDYIDILNNFKKNICLKIHIKINSGMNRLGFDENEGLEFLSMYL